MSKKGTQVFRPDADKALKEGEEAMGYYTQVLKDLKATEVRLIASLVNLRTQNQKLREQLKKIRKELREFKK